MYESLDQRAQFLLKELIRNYIRDGQPVGSKLLAQRSGLQVSSATIRNIMARLEDVGLIHSPHTSAGRVPTEAGYRFFIDSLIEIHQPEKTITKNLETVLNRFQTSGDLMQSASNMLSVLTQLTGLVRLPTPERSVIRHVEFLALSDKRILAIIVINDDEVHNRVMQVDREFSEKELQAAAKTINEHFVGRDFETALEQVLEDIEKVRDDMNAMMSSALQVMQGVCGEVREDLVLSGQANLMQFAELSDVEKLRGLFEAFNQKRDLLHLLDRCAQADGIEIFIGQESGYEVLNACSVISAPYQSGGKTIGVLGVIGPQRISYEKVIPVVDVTAKILSAALNSEK